MTLAITPLSSHTETCLTHPVFIVRFHALKTVIHLIPHRLPLKIVACFVRDKFSYSCLPSRRMHVFLVKGFFWIICRGPNTGCIAAFLKVLLSAAHSQCLCSCVFMVSCSFWKIFNENIRKRNQKRQDQDHMTISHKWWMKYNPDEDSSWYSGPNIEVGSKQ